MLTTIQQLQNFVDLWNKGFLTLDKDKLTLCKEAYSNEVNSSYTRQFVSKTKARNAIGLSEVGKPAILLALKHLSYKQDSLITVEEITIQTQLRFHLGEVFESLIIQLLTAHGFEIDGGQSEIWLDNIAGHIDGIVNQDTVVEIKTMSDSYFRRFTKEPEDSRGYLTQLNLYCHLLDKPGAWLCLNKQTNDLALVPLVPSKQVIERAKEVIKYVNKVERFADIFDYFQAPDADREMYKRQETGKFILPESMRYCSFAECFYDLRQELNGYKKLTNYVVGYHDVNVACDKYNNTIELPF